MLTREGDEAEQEKFLAKERGDEEVDPKERGREREREKAESTVEVLW